MPAKTFPIEHPAQPDCDYRIQEGVQGGNGHRKVVQSVDVGAETENRTTRHQIEEAARGSDGPEHRAVMQKTGGGSPGQPSAQLLERAIDDGMRLRRPRSEE